MVKIKIICIGKIKEPYLRDAIAEYSKRISSFSSTECVESPESPVTDNHPASREQAVRTEGERLIQSIGPESFVVALDRTGKQCSSEYFAEIIRKCEVNGPYQIDFLIGGPHGLSDACRKRADIILSLSDMTFPHQLARLILLE